eukprot:Sdes_comp10040_c0_seq1m1634
MSMQIIISSLLLFICFLLTRNYLKPAQTPQNHARPFNKKQPTLTTAAPKTKSSPFGQYSPIASRSSRRFASEAFKQPGTPAFSPSFPGPKQVSAVETKTGSRTYLASKHQPQFSIRSVKTPKAAHLLQQSDLINSSFSPSFIDPQSQFLSADDRNLSSLNDSLVSEGKSNRKRLIIDPHFSGGDLSFDASHIKSQKRRKTFYDESSLQNSA